MPLSDGALGIYSFSLFDLSNIDRQGQARNNPQLDWEGILRCEKFLCSLICCFMLCFIFSLVSLSPFENQDYELWDCHGGYWSRMWTTNTDYYSRNKDKIILYQLWEKINASVKRLKTEKILLVFQVHW